MDLGVSTTVGVDGHCDTLGELVEKGGRLRDPNPGLHIDLPRLAKGGVDLQVFACCAPFSSSQMRLAGRPGSYGVLSMFDRLLVETEGPDPVVRLVRTKNEVRQLRNWVAAGRPADRPGCHAVLAIEGGEALEGSLAHLRDLFRLGLRLLTVTHNRRNELADGVEESETAGGLSSFGREVILECHRLGIVVDISHLATAGFWDVMRLAAETGAPIVASHSNSRSLSPRPDAPNPQFLQYRNLTDDQALAIAATGGVVAVTFVPLFLRPDGRANLSDVLDHLEHFLALLGPDHVAIGSDFDGIPSPPVGLEDVSRRPAIAHGLLARGHSETVVGKVMGENWLRVFETVFPTENGR